MGAGLKVTTSTPQPLRRKGAHPRTLLSLVERRRDRTLGGSPCWSVLTWKHVVWFQKSKHDCVGIVMLVMLSLQDSLLVLNFVFIIKRYFLL